MSTPGILAGAVLLMLCTRVLPALEFSLEASLQNHHAVVSGGLTDFSGDELAGLLDNGRTIRLTWIFRLAGSDESVVRYAHRDPIGRGYLVYGPEPDEDPIPVDADLLIKELSTLHEIELSSLGPWLPEDLLESRIYLDRDLMLPPMSIRSFFGHQRERSSWETLIHPSAASE